MNKDNKFIFYLVERSNVINSSSSSSSVLSESNSSSENINISSSSEDEDLLLFPLMKFLLSGQRRLRIEDYLEIIDQWSDQDFKEHLRINRYTALILIGITMNI